MAGVRINRLESIGGAKGLIDWRGDIDAIANALHVEIGITEGRVGKERTRR